MYGADGKLLAPDHVIVNQSAHAVQGPVKFLVQDLINSGHVSESVANRTALATVKQIAAIRQAHLVCISLAVHVIHGWSEKFSASTIGGNSIGKMFFPNLVICYKHPCEIASHSIK
jgi:hypothetical protein